MTTVANPAASELGVDFENTFSRDLEGFSVEWAPDRVPHPELVILNQDLAVDLGIGSDTLDTPDGAGLLAGNTVSEGSTPIAMAYAGHQFGGYSPLLGDGRAVLLGEVIDAAGIRRDIHLKGSGRTPFARGGDGKAALGPMLREFLIAEAMHALGAPTTRALAVVSTGEQIQRDTFVPGAILARVASSHLRVGTFEYAARLDDETAVRRLADYALVRHHHTAWSAQKNPYLFLLEEVVDAQAALLAQWMLLGFVHGVMNTDNVTISGEGIDYGPCAFMDRYDPETVFSSIDRDGRYAYGNQPMVTQWNLARLAETLLPLIDTDRNAAATAAIERVEGFSERYRKYWTSGMAVKLGLNTTTSEGDETLFEDYLALLNRHALDYTSSFRDLARHLRGDDPAQLSGFIEHAVADGWFDQYLGRLDQQGLDPRSVAATMDSVNPAYIPRNHLLEEALGAADDGDLGPYEQLLAAVTNPFEERDDHKRYASPAPDTFTNTYQTFCGT